MGFKSKSLVVLSAFVVVFGGVLTAPAQAEPGDCYVEVEPGPSPQPTPVVVPTTCPTAPPPVTVTIPVPVSVPTTVVVTKTVIKTVYVDRTPTPSASPEPSFIPSGNPVLFKTPDPPTPLTSSSMDNGDLFFWGAGVAGLLSVALTTVGVVSVVRRRRYQGAHAAPEDQDDEWYGVSDYGPSQQDDTIEMPVVKEDPNTEVLPPEK